MDANTGRRVHDCADPQLRLDGGVQDGFLLLQVQHEAQFREGQARRPSQTEQCVVEVHSVTAKPPVMGGT